MTVSTEEPPGAIVVGWAEIATVGAPVTGVTVIVAVAVAVVVPFVPVAVAVYVVVVAGVTDTFPPVPVSRYVFASVLSVMTT